MAGWPSAACGAGACLEAWHACLHEVVDRRPHRQHGDIVILQARGREVANQAQCWRGDARFSRAVLLHACTAQSGAQQ